MREIKFSADQLIAALLNLSKSERVCLLDSGGASNLGSHLLIAGVRPSEVLEITGDDAEKTLEILDEKLSDSNAACIYTISYDFGLKLQKIVPRPKEFVTFPEPDVYLTAFDCLIIHDYDTGKTRLAGNAAMFAAIESKLISNIDFKSEISNFKSEILTANPRVQSNFTRVRQFDSG